MRYFAVFGGAALGLGLSIAGYIIAGIPGEVVGLLFTVPAAMLFGFILAK